MDAAIIHSGKTATKKTVIKVLLACGIVSSLFYTAMNIFVPLNYPGYSFMSQTVSELSAIDAPTRNLWVALGAVYTVMIAAYGWGLTMAAAQGHQLRNAGILLILYAVIGLFWPPMHQREVIAAGGGTITDTLHLVFTFISVLIMMLIIVFCALALGRGFRLYSIITMLILTGFGVLTAMDAPNLEANVSTPWMGVWERISIGAYMIWILVLAVIVLRRKN